MLDAQRKLLGTVPLRKLLLSGDEVRVETLMNQQFVCVHTTDDQELVADTVRKYDLICIPVVDNEERMVGIITIDDIVDVIEEENTEDFEKMAAMPAFGGGVSQDGGSHAGEKPHAVAADSDDFGDFYRHDHHLL